MKLLIAACAFLALAGTLLADDVTLTGGRVIQGKILEEGDDTLVIQGAFGVLKIPRDQVARIVRKPYVAPPKAAPAEEAPPLPSPAPPRPQAPPEVRGGDEAEIRARIGTAVTSFQSRERSEDADSAEASLAALGRPAVPLIAAEIPGQPSGPAVHLVRVLALIGGPEAIEALTGQLSSPLEEVRAAAATALAALGARDAAKPLTALLKDKDWAVRRDAAAAVAALRLRSALPDLADLLADSHLLVRGQALDALKQLTGEDLGYETGPWKAWIEANPDFLKNPD